MTPSTTNISVIQRKAFTLVEVMIAIGVFALGMVAVAALFPTAILMQQRMTQDVEAGFVANNAKAMMLADKFTYNKPSLPITETGDLDGLGGTNDVQAVPSSLLGSTGKWSPANRAYLGNFYADEFAPYYWVPLVQNATGDANDPDWRVFAFVIRPDARDRAAGSYDQTTTANDSDPDTIPKVKSYSISNVTVDFRNRRTTFNTNAPVGGGDYILTNTGIIYQVLSKEKGVASVYGLIPSGGNDLKEIWCSPRINDERPSPAIGVSIVVEAVNVLN